MSAPTKLPLLLALLAAPLNAQRVTAVVNVGDWTPRLAMHSIAAVFGERLADRECTAQAVPLPNELCGVSVMLTDATGAQALAPLFYVSPGQINMQVPASQWFIGKDPDRKQQSITAAARVWVRPADAWLDVILELTQEPAFLEYQSGSGPAPLLLHTNGSLVTESNPAAWGETLIAYAVGVGVLTEDGVTEIAAGRWPSSFPEDGHPAPLDRLVEFFPGLLQQVTGSVGGIPIGERYTIPKFVGLAPGFVGLSQINFELSCILSERAEPEVFLEGFMHGRTKAYRIPMSANAKAAWPRCF